MKKTKCFKIDGILNVPVEVDEEKLEDLFLEFCQRQNFEFQGVIEDKSKSK